MVLRDSRLSCQVEGLVDSSDDIPDPTLTLKQNHWCLRGVPSEEPPSPPPPHKVPCGGRACKAERQEDCPGAQFPLSWESKLSWKQSLTLQTVHSFSNQRVIFLCAQCGKDSWSQDSLFSHSRTQITVLVSTTSP